MTSPRHFGSSLRLSNRSKSIELLLVQWSLGEKYRSHIWQPFSSFDLVHGVARQFLHVIG